MSTKRVALADLGWCVGRMGIDDTGIAESLIIFSPAETNSDRYAPAESICISGRENLLALKRFLDENLQAVEHGGSVKDLRDGTEESMTAGPQATKRDL